jgi:hypothetical protein
MTPERRREISATGGKQTMAQGPAGIAPQLFWVDALWCGKANFGSEDCDEGCFCGDSGGYVIKKDTPTKIAPHCEWFCSSLAVKVGVPQLGFDLVKHTDGNLWFGSEWKTSRVRDWWTLAAAGKIKFADLASDISRIYALDLFIHNPDRHMNNYFVVPDGTTHKIYSFDYGRSWMLHGLPLPPVMADPALHTVNVKDWLKINFPNYFDTTAANAVLDNLTKVTEANIADFIGKHPNHWLQPPLADINGWWKAHAATRIDQIRNGIANGSLI